MILFCDANGMIQKNFGTPVYQGSANSNILYLIAPYAPNSTVMVGFQLPDGTAVEGAAMTQLNAVPGVQNADGTTFSGWSYVLPASVTTLYGTVTVQFFFYAPAGETENPTAIIATSSTTFQIGRGVQIALPDTPDADVYQSILTNIALLQSDLTNGYFSARSIKAWSNGATYGQNEITFYPDIGQYGAFVQSEISNNTNNAPYVNGEINSAFWSEVVNFNNIAEDYFQQIQAAQQSAAQSADNAQEAANAAQSSANVASQSAADANQWASSASVFSADAQAAASAALGSQYEAQAAQDAAQTFADQAETAVSNAQDYSNQAANSATEAQSYAYQAQQYAQKHYQIVASYDALPRPGDPAYIYLVPTSSSTSGDTYSEYLWISESNNYELIGTTGDVNLDNYAQIDGTYPNMTVGNATNATNATTAGKVANLLTINLNGQPYKQYNGSQAVSIDITSAGSSTEVILAASAWSENRQDVTLENITAASNVDIYPKDISAAAYINAGILVSQTDEKLIFTCVTTPSSDITIIVEVAF